MSYVKSLRDILREKDVKLYNRLTEIEKQARNVLQYAQAKFPYYTPHGFLHSENVLENLNWLLSEELKMEFNTHELFFLIISAWLHDWGLIGEPHEKPQDIRDNHHVRTEEKFEKLYSLIGVHLNEALIIGRICRGHRKENLYNDKYEDTPFEAGLIIHRRFLAAALRIADEIDIAANRVPEIIYYDLNPTEKAKDEFEKQMNIIGIAYPSEREKYKLVLSAIAWDPLGVVALKKLREKIQEELNHVKTILATGINGKGIVLDYVELKIDTRGFMKESIEFQIDREKILDLLIGRTLYSRKDVAIRELIQNSIDACRLRKAIEGDYPAQIKVIDNDSSIIIEDNGIGMDFTTAKNYLSLVGSSFYLSDEFKKLVSESKRFDPISRWGLGILACFLISSQVIIETKRTNAQPCRFIISSVDKGWRYEVGSTNKTGTKVTLHLNEEGRRMDIEKALDYYVKIPEFPIFVRKGGRRKRFMPKWNLETEILKRTKDPNLSEDLAEQMEKYGKPKIAFEYHAENEDFDVAFYGIDWKGYVWDFFPEKFFVCIQGIKTRIPKERYPEFESKLITFLNIKKNIVEYEVARECLVADEKLTSLIQRVFLAYIGNLKRDFEQRERTEKMNAFERDIRWIRFLRDRMDYDYFETSEKRKMILNTSSAMLSSEGWVFDKLKSMFEHKPEHVLFFNIGRYSYFADFQQLMKELERSRVLVEDFIKKGETAYFCIMSVLGSSWSKEIEQLFSVHGIDYEISNLQKYAILSSKKVSTPIDSLLPPICHFAEIPEEYNAWVIRTNNFSRNDTTDPDLLRVAKSWGPALLFEDLPSLSEMIRPYGSEIPAKNSITFGRFLINVKKEPAKMLIDNADRVLSDKCLLLVAKAFIRSMVLLHTNAHPSLREHARGMYTVTSWLIEQSLRKTDEEKTTA